MKQLTLFADDREVADFEQVKALLERKSDADTIRAMINFCKKNLTKNINISTTANSEA